MTMTAKTTAPSAPLSLSDLIPFRPRPTPTDKDTELWTQWVDRTLREIRTVAGTRCRTDWAREELSGEKRRNRFRFSHEAVALYAQTGVDPVRLPTPSDPLKRLSALPTVTLGAVRTVAAALNFTVIPMDRFDLGRSGMDPTTDKLLRRFRSDTDRSFDLYVVTPNDFVLPVPPPTPPVPVPDPIRDRLLQTLKAQQDILDAQRDEIRNLKRQLDRAIDKIDDYSARVRKTDPPLPPYQPYDPGPTPSDYYTEDQIDKRNAYHDFWEAYHADPCSHGALDPMVIAVPKGQSVTGDGWAIVGPTWGTLPGTFDPTALGLRVYKGQTARLHKTLSKP